METSKGTWPNYDSCRLITLLTHAGVWKFRLQNLCWGIKCPSRTNTVWNICASDDANFMAHELTPSWIGGQQGPQVLDMKYREPDRLEHGPGGPIFSPFQRLHLVNSNNIHHLRLGPVSEMVLAPWGNESGYHGMCHSDPQNLWICASSSFVSNECLDLILIHLTMFGGNDRMP